MTDKTLASLALTVALFSLAPTATAQKWAEKMFQATSHEFGSVAAGADAEYRFEITNLYVEDVHIAAVRSSCGCTNTRIENDTLKSFEKGYIVARFNTRTFRGYRSATLTVTIDKPFPAEVRLQVQGNIRGDIQFNPGSVRFDNVDQGLLHERTVKITKTGRPNWEIVDVRSASEYIEVERPAPSRQGGTIAYELLIRLKDDAPAGFFNEQLVLVTNDGDNQRIPLEVEGQVVPEISVSPNQLVLGDVQPGQEIRKRLVVKGKRPFKITSVDCADGCFSFTPASAAAKKVHLVDVTFNAGDEPGTIRQAIRISTDRGANIGVDLTAYATVVDASPSSAVAAPIPGGTVSTE